MTWELACPARIWFTTESAVLVGTAKPTAEAPLRVLLCPAVVIPMTWPAELTSGPPESPGAMVALLSIMPVRCSGAAPPAAVIDWSRATISPLLTLGVPPTPPALPIAATASPVVAVEESARVAVGSPAAPSSWIRATSAVGSTPRTAAW